MDLLDGERLARSSVVANCAMNRERGLKSYQRELGIDLSGVTGIWVDLCCGEGRALLEAADQVDATIIGVDLVDHFAARSTKVRFVTASVDHWAPDGPVDLVTCVHGLHYVGDKLGLLERAAGWLKPDGLLVANFEAAGIRLADGLAAGRRLTKALRDNGFIYDGRKRRISFSGPGRPRLPYTYVGADDKAGPNYTGQPAVHSYYD